MARKFLISRVALAVALASGAALVAAPPALAQKQKAQKGPKIEFSPAFQKAAAELDKTVSESAQNPAVTAASQKAQAAKSPAEKQAAAAEVDAALGGARTKLEAARAAASTTGDKLKLAELTRNLGVLYGDTKMQHEGLVGMLNSGALGAEQTPQVQFLAGVTAYQNGDYAGAVQYLKPAHDAGYKDRDGLIDRVLADAYKRSNNPAAAMELANQELASARASGGKPSEGAIRTALQAAYDAKNVARSAELSADLARDYPTPANWATSVGVVRSLTALPSQDNLDLMRLMSRTNSLQEKRDYLEYIENADPRRLPGETLKVIDAGVSSGKLTAGEVAEYRQIASGRLSADRASLAGLEREAQGGRANAATVSAAADAFLSYEQPAKAEELYKIALGKPGVDKDRALTRLGIAQADQGKYADAQQTFAQVGGVRAPVAKLWTAYVASKSGGGAPSQAAATSPAAPR